MDLTPYYQKFGWDSRINTGAIEGMTFEGVKGGVPFIAAGSAPGTTRRLREGGHYVRAGELRRAGRGQREAAGRRNHTLGHGGKYGWHIMRLYEYLLETQLGQSCTTSCLPGRRAWDRRGRHRLHELQEVAGQEVDTGGGSGSRSRRRRALVRAGKTAYDHWTMDRGGGYPDGQEGPADFGLPAPDRTHAPRHSGFVEGYMINAKSGNPDKSAELIDFIVKPETQKALKITRPRSRVQNQIEECRCHISGRRGREAAVLHHPGPGVSEEGGRCSTSRSRVTCCRARPVRPRLRSRCRTRCRPGRRADPAMGTATLEAPAVDAPVVRRRRRKYGGLNAWLFALPALAVYVIFLVYPALSSLWFSFTDWDGLSPTYNVVGLENYPTCRRTRWSSRRDQQHHLDRGHHHLSSCHRSGAGHAFERQGAREARAAADLLYTCRAATGGDRLDLGLALQPVRCDQLLPAADRAGQPRPALAWARLDCAGRGDGAGYLASGRLPMLLYLAALQGINKRCTRPRRLTERLSPNSSGTSRCPACGRHYIVIALSLIDSFKVFDLIYAMTYGGPGTATQVMGTWMYFNVFQYYQAGYGTAIAVVITVVAIAVSIPTSVPRPRSMRYE